MKQEQAPKDCNETHHYAVEIPVLLTNEKINYGAPILGKLAGVQTATLSGQTFTIESFEATLSLPAFVMQLNDETIATINDSSVTVRLADPKALADLNHYSGAVNKAEFSSSPRMMRGLIGLEAELPGDEEPAYAALPFSCLLEGSANLSFSGHGQILTGLFAGTVLACCGIKTPGPTCTVTIANTVLATKTVSGGVLGVSGLVQTATSSAGHTFTPGTVPVTDVQYWRNGQSMARPGFAATINAAGVITFPNFAISCPLKWLPIRAGDVAEFTTNVTDVAGERGTKTNSHIF